MCADVRLVFKNAMKYNNERHDVHVMAKTLLDKFEDKWLQLLPKVDEELDVVDKHLKSLRDVVLQNCRKMSTEEKKALMTILTQLSPEDINKALLIVTQSNPYFQATGQEVDLDIDAQVILNTIMKRYKPFTYESAALYTISVVTIKKRIISIPNFTETNNNKAYDNIFYHNMQIEATLWKLKFFVKDILQAQGKSPTSIGEGGNNTLNNNVNQNKWKFVTNDAP
nr:transcription factor GTE1-like [Tanacetum cinerariifolium]